MWGSATRERGVLQASDNLGARSAVPTPGVQREVSADASAATEIAQRGGHAGVAPPDLPRAPTEPPISDRAERATTLVDAHGGEERGLISIRIRARDQYGNVAEFNCPLGRAGDPQPVAQHQDDGDDRHGPR